VGRSNRPGSSRSRFWFCRIFVCEFVRLDQRSVLVKSWLVLELFVGFSLVVILAGYRRLDRP
jgi:hypothetical protein